LDHNLMVEYATGVSEHSATASAVDVLIVGAGPTGLALATQLHMFGTRFRIIDRSLDRAGESRALGVQARTLEILDSVGLGNTLVARGRRSARLVLHFGARTIAAVQLGDIGPTDTRFPFILFISQAETERLMGKHLVGSGVTIERGVELMQFDDRGTHVDCVLRRPNGSEEQVRTGYLVGCDGAHSTVRKGAGFSFEGGSYPQDFVLGDVEADGPLEPRAINSFVGSGGVAMFFPLGTPSTWRVIAMRSADPGARQHDDPTLADALTGPLTLEELQAIVAPPTGGSVGMHDPVWLTHFRLHHRQIEHYRSGCVFLAGDAAHIHSPVGAQGMNTGIQDAWNLGWKLALVARGMAEPDLLDSYEAERWPVGRFLLRYTDRFFAAFTRAMSAGRLATWTREVIVPRAFPLLLGCSRFRTTAFRFVSELAIHYRKSPASREGEPRVGTGPRAGDRLPDARLTMDGHPVWLQEAVIGPHLSLLLCGDVNAWGVERIATLAARHDGLLRVRYLSRQPGAGELLDKEGYTLAQLAGDGAAQYLVRPDGYIAFRCAGRGFNELERYMMKWFRESTPG
jgi:2-polyprenyl-6-methoxyphenol hydroxylase-like FAD-dependent oxidoreductase